MRVIPESGIYNIGERVFYLLGDGISDYNFALNDHVSIAIEVTAYIKSIESMLLDAGLVKSMVSDNLDTDNIVFPTVSVSSSTYHYIADILQFDMNDTEQELNPLRILFRFGFYRNSGNTTYPISLRFEVGVKSLLNNKEVWFNTNNLTAGMNTATIKDRFGRGGFTPLLHDAGAESFIVKTDGFFAMNLHPLSFEYMTTYNTIDTSFFWLVIDRNNQSANVMGYHTSGMANYVFSSTREPYVDTSLIHYVDSGFVYSDGKMVLYPTHVFDGLGESNQSPNVILTNSNGISCGAEVIIHVNNVPVRFKAMSGSSASGINYFFRNTGRVLVRIE